MTSSMACDAIKGMQLIGFWILLAGLTLPLFGEARTGLWKEECPAGYVLVPRNSEYVDQNFCVMKYEARALTTAGTVDVDGCNEGACTTGGWGLASHSPASTESGLPWRMIGQAQAVAECQSLGPRYDLISNAQWQTIARNLELVPANWTSGTVGTGCMFTGNTNDATCGYNGPNPEGGSGRNTRARLFLSNGQEIWDLSGNLTEWVADPNTTGYGVEAFMAAVTLVTHATTGVLNDQTARSAKNQFGPSGIYAGCNNAGNDYCGLGYGWLAPANGAFARGGNYNDTFYAGVFMNYLLNGTGGGGSNNTGFRCAYLPNDPCLSGKNVTPGARCGGPTQPTATQVFVGQYLGFDYYTTPSGCTNSSTPTCDGTTDTMNWDWFGITGSNADIPEISNIAAAATLPPFDESGAANTPVIVAHPNTASDSFAHYCSNMVYGGQSDWFLPNKSELSLLYCNASVGSHSTSNPQESPDCYTLGGKTSFITGFATTDQYWTSTENDSTAVWSQNFTNGSIVSDLKGNGGFVRCMRREPSRDPCAGNPTLGTTCRGGALYAGLFDGGKYMITPGNCLNSATPTCDGATDALTKIYRGSAGSNVDIAGLTNNATQSTPSLTAERGHVATPVLTGAASISSDSAADYCADLVFGGYRDWYLPSKSEMAHIYCKSNASSHNTLYPHEDPNCSFLGGKSSELTNFSGNYWTASEVSSTNAWLQSSTDGAQTSSTKSGSASIRCVRRYEAPAPSRLQLVAASNAESTTDLVTGTFTPRNNSLLVAVIGGAAEDGVPTVTLTGGGLTWTQRVSVNNESSNYPGWHTFSEIWTAPVITGTVMTGTLSVNRFTDGKAIVIYQYTGHNTSDPIGATATGFRDDASGSYSINLSATPAVDSEIIATTAINNWDGTGSDNYLSGTGWTQTYGNGSVGAETQVQVQTRAAPNSNVIGWSLVDALEAAGANATTVGLEIKRAP